MNCPMLITQKVNWRSNLREWKYMLLFGFLQTFIQYGFFFMGLNKIPAAVSAIIIGGGPLFVAVIAHFTIRNDRLTARKVFAILLGLLGIVFISSTKGNLAGSGFSFYYGIALLIISNIVGASTNIIVAKNRDRVSPVMLTAVANFTGGILLYIVSYFTEDWFIKSYTSEFYIAWLWLALIPAAGFSIWYSLLKQPVVKVSELNMWKFVVPVTGVILSWLLLPGENADLYSVAGIAIISIALITLQWKPQKNE